METKLARIAQAAKDRPAERFTSLFHHINEWMLRECHREMEAGKARASSVLRHQDGFEEPRTQLDCLFKPW